MGAVGGLLRTATSLEKIAADAKKRAQARVITWRDWRDNQDGLVQIGRRLIDTKLELASSLAPLWLATEMIDIKAGTPEALALSFRTPPPH